MPHKPGQPYKHPTKEEWDKAWEEAWRDEYDAMQVRLLEKAIKLGKEFYSRPKNQKPKNAD